MKWRVVPAVLAAILLQPRMSGVEKWYLVPGSDLIVIARLENLWRVPWLDGWHLWGNIRVERVIFGQSTPEEVLKFKFLCACVSRSTALVGAS